MGPSGRALGQPHRGAVRLALQGTASGLPRSQSSPLPERWFSRTHPHAAAAFQDSNGLVKMGLFPPQPPVPPLSGIRTSRLVPVETARMTTMGLDAIRE